MSKDMQFVYGLLLVFAVESNYKCNGLSPSGSNVCSHECHTLEWKTVNVTRSCGYPLYVQACTLRIRQPVMQKATCYDCCEGWRQTDNDNCLKGCPSGNAGISSCDEIPNGWYQLCDACDEFAQCDEGKLARMRCPKRRKWDDYSKKCVKHSQTCEVKTDDKARFNTEKEHIVQTNQDTYNEITNEVGFEVPDQMLGCEDINCDAPARCMMMFAQDTYQPAPKCICPAGMRNSAINPGRCESINECVEQNPCENGVCVNRKFGYKCKCEKGWRGRHCNKPKKRNRKTKVRYEVHRGRNNENDDDDDSWDWPQNQYKNNNVNNDTI